MEFLAGLEADGFTGCDGDFGAGAGISPDAGLARLDREDAEAAKLDAVAFDERSFHALEDGVNRRFGFRAWQSGSFDNPLYQVLLNHLSKDPSPGFRNGGRGPVRVVP